MHASVGVCGTTDGRSAEWDEAIDATWYVLDFDDLGRILDIREPVQCALQAVILASFADASRWQAL